MTSLDDGKRGATALESSGPDAMLGSTPHFTLRAVASADGFIARHAGHNPADWASAEEQGLFLAAVDKADWSVMGRGTHETAFRPLRRRVVFSRSVAVPEWRNARHLWLNADGLTPDTLAALTASRLPMRRALILGGTEIHDWFHANRRIHAVALTVEPVRFGAGLPLFCDQRATNAVAAFVEKGFRVVAERALNPRGTRLVTLSPLIEGS